MKKQKLSASSCKHRSLPLCSPHRYKQDPVDECFHSEKVEEGSRECALKSHSPEFERSEA
ncbi:hypothetical protein LEMLEM_LOCUS26231 [Lemmus lemmus]